ncbi:MAG TPA: ATP-binding protein [Xanthobacteraceae bacterium]|nr:ATP-binding protein [Xanthobacteraceae bacterium]
MLTLATKDDLEKLIRDGVIESLTLDYKASPALGKDSKSRDELCKDVSAFANSAGGQIIYGIEEDKTVPTKLDDGADLSITKEWIEQIIDSRIQPRIEGLIIRPIQLAKGYGFVITIPQATSRAPHQAPDKKYYKRQNFQSVAMEDYEIRDVLRRATTPVLQVGLSIGQSNTSALEFVSGQESSKPITLRATVANQSSQPAYHSVLYIGLDIDLVGLIGIGGFDWSSPPHGQEGDRKKRWLAKRFTSPPDQPLFQEATHGQIAINFSIPSKFSSEVFDITTVVQTPGCASTDYWAIACGAPRVKLYGPNDPNYLPDKIRRGMGR